MDEVKGLLYIVDVVYILSPLRQLGCCLIVYISAPKLIFACEHFRAYAIDCPNSCSRALPSQIFAKMISLRCSSPLDIRCNPSINLPFLQNYRHFNFSLSRPIGCSRSSDNVGSTSLNTADRGSQGGKREINVLPIRTSHTCINNHTLQDL